MDEFREWLSDNLRYFMLGGAILLIVVVLFFGVRACIGIKKGNSSPEEQNTEQQPTEDNDQGNVPSSPDSDGETNDGKKEEDTNPMEKNNAEISALITSFYKALTDKDIDLLRTLENDLSGADEARITNSREYITGYEVQDVYSKKGLTEGSYVVYASYNFICQGIDTPVPALSWFYVITDIDGSLKIDGNAQKDEEILAYTNQLREEDDVMALTVEIKEKNEEAQLADPELKAFLEGLGEEADVSVPAADGETMTVTDNCNFRAEPDSESEVLDVLLTGTEVTKTGEDGEWIQVDYQGTSGYIHSSLLK